MEDVRRTRPACRSVPSTAAPPCSSLDGLAPSASLMVFKYRIPVGTAVSAREVSEVNETHWDLLR